MTVITPRLFGIAGPHKGSTIPLPDGTLAVGRDEANSLCIPEPSVSRRHCLIERSLGTVRLSDLESRNGTIVNGLPVKQRVLEHGDTISLGTSQFLFLTAADEAERMDRSVLVDDGADTVTATVQLRAEDVLYLQPDRIAAALPAKGRVAHDLNTLLKISTTINSTHGLEALEERLLQLIFEVIPAEGGAILLCGGDNDPYSSICTRSRVPDRKRPLRLSRTVIDRVLREGIAILSNDIRGSGGLNCSESLVAASVSSLLAVPLVALDRKVGVLYLDRQDSRSRFDESHLQLATAIAAMAAAALDNALRIDRLESENQRLLAEINLEHHMVGESSRMRDVYQFIAKAAPVDSTVMLRGESGTGKELVARAIHQNSRRARMPFVPINCAAITDTLLESELFGHEKGAFTGAISQKKGKLEIADGGTLFLDEIGELAPPVQAKLLRVLQAREFERVGGVRPIQVDIRLITATNKDLEEAIKDGAFRQDLYYRLNVLSLALPPLRERREDIGLLASYFASKYADRSRRRLIGISPEARACLMTYHWPGNVRELENAIERAVVLGSSEYILPEDLPETILEAEAGNEAVVARYHEAVKQTKKQLIIHAVEQANGNYTDAAKMLGVHPNYLHRLIRNMNLKSHLKKTDASA